MSTAYELYCATCDSRHDNFTNRECRNPASLAELIHERHLLAQLCAVASELKSVTVRLEYGAVDTMLDLTWITAHAGPGHDLVVRDEYGAIYGKCAGPVTCKCCRHRIGYCALEIEHQGECEALEGRHG